MTDPEFAEQFERLTGYPPLSWQTRLFRDHFAKGDIPNVIDLPTGLGKTMVMAIWLIARTINKDLPRRLVYVVDRRTVVDQATTVAETLRSSVERNNNLKNALGLKNRPLPVSTLRGQFVDNREWLEDPARPAIIVGTVDMIGSRLLFEGYGVSRKMRPYHAGLLGADTLVILDEAHLVPPFEKLLESIAEGGEHFGPRDESRRLVVPPFKLVSLSATSRSSNRASFKLNEQDLKDPVVARRLSARKRIMIKETKDDETLPEALAKEAWDLADNGRSKDRIIIFCDSRKAAEEVKVEIEMLSKTNRAAKPGQDPPYIEPPELFVGGRRVRERNRAEERLEELGFIADTNVDSSKTRFLIATSAGEVGVDIDADHMVSDLVTWERMIQRLGRVNRRGGDGRIAKVVIVMAQESRSKNDDADAEFETALKRPFNDLPLVDNWNDCRDGSPGALRNLKLKAAEDDALAAILDAATAVAPLRPALTRAVVDAWSMTSLDKHTGRPDVAPWLRGWKEDDSPQTAVVWRTYLPVRSDGPALSGGFLSKKEVKDVEAFFEAAPPHVSEQLETETSIVVDWLAKRSQALKKKKDNEESNDRGLLDDDDFVAFAFSPNGDFRRRFKLRQLDVSGDEKKHLFSNLAGATLIIDAQMAGLKDGLLNSKEQSLPQTVDNDDEWLPLAEGKPVVRFRVLREASDQETESVPKFQSWRERFRYISKADGDSEPHEWLTVMKWMDDSSTEDDRGVGQPQLLVTHQQLAEQRARELVRSLRLPRDYETVLAIAARLHDEGKRSQIWQRAFNACKDGVYAKTVGPLNVSLLSDYRHEFGSLKVAESDKELFTLPNDLQDLVLHLIAAHHGFSRPIIRTDGCEDGPPSVLEERARHVALRFAKLQKQWGPWGLAWWESLLRAVDHDASRENQVSTPSTAEPT
ncbi:MAG: type I-U CRISPR-associated helicase/endonuclease Cas3 [Planctomycetota bacterium]